MRSLLLGCFVHDFVYPVWAFVVPSGVSYKRIYRVQLT
jgi:hypothetical protein